MPALGLSTPTPTLKHCQITKIIFAPAGPHLISIFSSLQNQNQASIPRLFYLKWIRVPLQKNLSLPPMIISEELSSPPSSHQWKTLPPSHYHQWKTIQPSFLASASSCARPSPCPRGSPSSPSLLSRWPGHQFFVIVILITIITIITIIVIITIIIITMVNLKPRSLPHPSTS